MMFIRQTLCLVLVAPLCYGGDAAELVEKRVFLIRHGKSIWNESKNLFRNWRDSPLSATGITQCTDGYGAIIQNGLYNYLRKQHHEKNLKSFFSPLTRAAETILLMFGLQDDFAFWYDAPGCTEEVPLNLVPLPDACERVSTSPNDGEGTDKFELIDRYASFAGRGLDKMGRGIIHEQWARRFRRIYPKIWRAVLNVDTKADPHSDKDALRKIAGWREARLALWKGAVSRVMNITPIAARKWWPNKDTFGWGLVRNREQKHAVTRRIESVMTRVMASKESDVVIAGHSHYFRQLIGEFLEVEGDRSLWHRAKLNATIGHYGKKTMKNTEVLMIDFTGERTGDGKYVVNKIETVYHPDRIIVNTEATFNHL